MRASCSPLLPGKAQGLRASRSPVLPRKAGGEGISLPSLVLGRGAGGEGRIKILDLGLARLGTEPAAGVELTSAGAAMGTADYMAPEQASDAHTAGARADVYSLGCTLYKLLSGHVPFGGPNYPTPLSA